MNRERLQDLENEFPEHEFMYQESSGENDNFEDDGWLHFRIDGRVWSLYIGQELPHREFNREVHRVCDFLEIPRSERSRLLD